MDNFIIVDATPEDAPLIAWTVMEAVGEQITEELAKGRTKEEVKNLFIRLAMRTDSQYSYLNSRVAQFADNEKAGVCVSYNGGDIKQLRRSFFAEANKALGWGLTDEEMESFPCETCGDEFYLDSIAVRSKFRGRGVGSALIDDACKKAMKAGLPLGLLVSDNNPNARKLYESCGFIAVGRRPFAGEEMLNMRMSK